MNRNQIMTEWDKAGITINGFTFNDVNDMYDDILHNVSDELEANKIMILAIRAAASVGGKTKLSVENNIRKWLLAGLTTAKEIGDYESQSQQMQQASRYGQPIQRETGPSKPTAEQIDQQNQRMAKELGYASVSEMAKGTADKLSELRRTRAERLADKSANGRTANGRRVVQRF